MLAVRLGMPVLTNRFYPEVTERLARFAGTSADKVRALSYGPVDSKVADFRGRAVPSRMLDGFSGIRRRLLSGVPWQIRSPSLLVGHPGHLGLPRPRMHAGRHLPAVPRTPAMARHRRHHVVLPMRGGPDRPGGQTHWGGGQSGDRRDAWSAG
ncbi:hypothetical protein [Dankookia sp. P2]|uniref:hypothetical protein n=1 Tax=Dankookia sp. P2 TaxID=3423955 RepID=UPI003D67162F